MIYYDYIEEPIIDKVELDIEEYQKMKDKIYIYELFVNHLKDLNIEEVNEAIEELEDEL